MRLFGQIFNAEGVPRECSCLDRFSLQQGSRGSAAVWVDSQCGGSHAGVRLFRPLLNAEGAPRECSCLDRLSMRKESRGNAIV